MRFFFHRKREDSTSLIRDTVDGWAKTKKKIKASPKQKKKIHQGTGGDAEAVLGGIAGVPSSDTCLRDRIVYWTHQTTSGQQIAFDYTTHPLPPAPKTKKRKLRPSRLFRLKEQQEWRQKSTRRRRSSSSA